MAFSSISYTDMDDFMTQMDTFLVANGWTQDLLDTSTDRAAWHKGNVFVQFTWNEINILTAFQSLSYDGSVPGSNPDDAGPLLGVRQMVWSNAPGTADLFSGTEQSSEFFYAAIEWSPERFSYIGFGEIIKKGDWTGGEWLAISDWGHGGGDQAVPLDARHYVLFDGRNDDSAAAASTMHVEGWPSQVAAEKWAAIGGNFANAQDDRAGNDREFWVGSGIREGFNYNAFQYLAFQPNAGFIPLQTIELWRREGSFRLGGFVPGFRGLNITNVEVQEELVVGSDTWKAYPWALKGDSGPFYSGLDGGMAFLKI